MIGAHNCKEKDNLKIWQNGVIFCLIYLLKKPISDRQIVQRSITTILGSADQEEYGGTCPLPHPSKPKMTLPRWTEK